MREHDTFGVGGGSTGIKKIAAHSWLLLYDPLDDDSVVNIFSNFKELSPIINFDTPKIGALLRFLPGTSSLSSENISKFTENNSYLHPKLNQSFFIYKVFFLQSLPWIANDHSRSWVLNLLETGLRWICNVLVREDVVCIDRAHDCHKVFGRIEPLYRNRSPLRNITGHNWFWKS